MRSPLARFSAAGALVLVACIASSCGDDEKDPPPPASATGGSGGGGSVGPVACGSKLCQPILLPGAPPVAACCSDTQTSRCGFDTSLLRLLGAQPTRSCEPVQQEGMVNAGCPDSTNVPVGPVSVTFKGCCRSETGQCGYLVDRVSLLSVGLGCVDSSPFLEGGAPSPCRP